jgi:hypothetical protein
MAFMIIVALLLAFIVYISIDDFPKKWRKFKFETIMGWNGFSSGTVDYFYRSVDKVCELICVHLQVTNIIMQMVM